MKEKTVAADEKTFGCGAGVRHGVGGGPRLYDDESRGLGDADCCGVSRKKLNLAVMTALAVALNALLRHLF